MECEVEWCGVEWRVLSMQSFAQNFLFFKGILKGCLRRISDQLDILGQLQLLHVLPYLPNFY